MLANFAEYICVVTFEWFKWLIQIFLNVRELDCTLRNEKNKRELNLTLTKSSCSKSCCNELKTEPEQGPV